MQVRNADEKTNKKKTKKSREQSVDNGSNFSPPCVSCSIDGIESMLYYQKIPRFSFNYTLAIQSTSLNASIFYLPKALCIIPQSIFYQLEICLQFCCITKNNNRSGSSFPLPICRLSHFSFYFKNKKFSSIAHSKLFTIFKTKEILSLIAEIEERGARRKNRTSMETSLFDIFSITLHCIQVVA